MRFITLFVAIALSFCLSFSALAQEQKAEIRVACGSVGIELKLCTEAVKRWSEKTGHPASVVSLPSSTSERLALYQQFLSAKQGGIDVFQLDVIWPGILKNHLEDLTQHVPQAEIDQHFESLIANNTVDGRLVALPLYTDVGILYYRKDMLEKYGLSVPKTWDDMTIAAKTIQKGEREAGTSDFWGYVWQGKAYEGLTCNALEWVSSSGGGTIVSDEGQTSIVNDEAIEAIDRAADWINTITPQGVLNYSEEEARGVFQSGKAAFMRNWPYAWSLAQGDESPIKGKVGVAMIPKGNAEGAKHSGTLGGWQMGVSRYSEMKNEAVELVRYLTGEEVQREYAIIASYNPTIKALYDDKEVLAALPASDVLYDALSQAVPRPSRITGVRYNQVSNGFWNAVHASLSQDGDAEENLKSLEHRLKRISNEGKWQRDAVAADDVEAGPSTTNWLLGLLFVIVVLGWWLTRSDESESKTKPEEQESFLTRQRVKAAWTFLMPMIIVLVLAAGWPLARTIYFSATDALLSDMDAHSFIGLTNFYYLLTDPDWWIAVRNTVMFTVTSVTLEVGLGLIVALALNANMPGRGLLRTSVMIPWAIPTIVSAQMWNWMFNDFYGVINAMMLGIGLISEPIAWTADPDFSLWAVVIADVWKTTPFMALLCLAALQVLPSECYEAAKVDGIHPVRVFFKVTLPIIKPALLVAVIFRCLDALRIFDLIYVLTSGSRSTMSMSIYARQQLVDFQDVGYGSAASTLLFMFIAFATVILLTVGKVKLDGEKHG